MEKSHSTQNPGKSLWYDAARDGGMIGLFFFVTMLLTELSRGSLDETWQIRLTSFVGVINFCVFAACIYIFTRKRSLGYADYGFTFSQSMGYIVVMMIFTGFVSGIGDYMAINVLSPDYYADKFDDALYDNPFLKVKPELMEESAQMVKALLKNPVYYIFVGISGKIIYGGIIGLFVSSVVKRPPLKQ